MAWHQIQSCIAYQKLKNPSYFSSSKCKAVSAFQNILSIYVHICELRIRTSTRPSTRKRSILSLSCLFRYAVWTSVKQAQTLNSVVDSGPLCACVFYVFLYMCLSVHVYEHSFFVLVIVLVLISQVKLIHLITVITLFRIISHLCQFDYFLLKYAVNY